MTQQAIKIGEKALSDIVGDEYIETIADATGLDATVNGVADNQEVIRIIVADNANLPDDLVLQAIETVRRVLSHERVTEIVQA